MSIQNQMHLLELTDQIRPKIIRNHNIDATEKIRILTEIEDIVDQVDQSHVDEIMLLKLNDRIHDLINGIIS